MEVKLAKWINEQIAKHVCISDMQIKAKAIEIFAQLHSKDAQSGIETDYCEKVHKEFQASTCWREKFCRRKGFSLRSFSSCDRKMLNLNQIKADDSTPQNLVFDLRNRLSDTQSVPSSSSSAISPADSSS
jgi:hypothetical protein